MKEINKTEIEIIKSDWLPNEEDPIFEEDKSEMETIKFLYYGP